MMNLHSEFLPKARSGLEVCCKLSLHWHCLLQAIEESIKSRDNAHVGTNAAVKNLEVHHVASLTDLRGRIVRCDTAIGKLSGDVRSCFDSIRQLNQQQQEMANRIMDRMHGLEQQVWKLNQG